MLKQKNKIILLICAFLIIIGAAILIYFLWFKKSAPIATEEQSIQQLIEERAQGVKFIANDNKLRFLSLESSTFKELDLETKKIIELTQIPMYLVKKIIWSPEGNRAILKVENNRALLSQEGYLLDKNAPDGTITTWSFDLLSGNLIELPLEVVGIDWLSENKIIYCYSTTAVNPDINPNEANVSLVEANYDGSDYQKIMDLDQSKFYNPQLAIAPDKNSIILSPEAEGVGKNYIYIADLKSKSIKNITEAELTIFGSWSSSGKNIFLYQADPNSPDNQFYDLWFANKEGRDKKKLNISAAYPLAITDKDDQNIYIVSKSENNQVIYQLNVKSSEKKILASSKDKAYFSKITELGLLNKNIYVISNEKIYLLKI